MGTQNVDKEKHNVFLYDRNKISMSGITDVTSFDENIVVLTICDGSVLTVEGSGLSISVLDLERGCVEAQGTVYAMDYSDSVQKTKQGLFSLIFRGR